MHFGINVSTPELFSTVVQLFSDNPSVNKSACSRVSQLFFVFRAPCTSPEVRITGEEYFKSFRFVKLCKFTVRFLLLYGLHSGNFSECNFSSCAAEFERDEAIFLKEDTRVPKAFTAFMKVVEIEERMEVLSGFASGDGAVVVVSLELSGSVRLRFVVCCENSNKEVFPFSRTGCPS